MPASPPAPSPPPRVRLLDAPALVAPRPLPFAPQRRFRLAAVLALSPQGISRDEVAALFWPDRPQAAARSNLRKLILELRELALPGICLDDARLAWPVDSDARDLLEGRHRPPAWTEPLPGLGGHDSAAFDEWLLAQRERLHDAWCAEPARGRRHDDLADDLPALVGRADELAELQALLRERRCRLLTLLGPGGVGKSALALALLRNAAAADVDSALWVALEDLDTAAQVPLRIARELGAPVGPRSDGWDESLAALRERQALLILDNAEHLPDLPPLLQRLADAVPPLRLLVTSRRRLGLALEWVLPLAPLAPAAARRLFVAAARRAPSRQPLDEADPPVQALAELLGGLPLALRLAAAWTRHLAPATLLLQLRHSVDLLQAAESPDEHPAHRSLQATFEHSWALLAPAAREALAALAVVDGSMRMDTALATAAATPLALAELADASLVDIEAGGRVTMHPLVRRFARARLDTGGAASQATLARHAQALADLLRPYADFDKVDVAQALQVIAPERRQLEQAWATAHDRQRADWLQVFASVLSGLVQAEGGVEPVLQLFRQIGPGLAAWPQASPELRADLALEHAALHFWRGDHDPCEAAARQALALARAARLQRPMSQALNLLALVALRRGRTERAAHLMERALRFAQHTGPAGTVAIMAGNLSGIWRELGHLDQARAHAERALQLHRDRGFAIGEVAMLAELAQQAHLLDRLDEADAWLGQAERLSERHSMALRRATLVTFRAAVRLDMGRLDEAEALAATALAAMQGTAGRHYHAPTLRRLLAELALARGDMAQAREQLRLACAQLAPLAADVNARGLLWSLAVLAHAAADVDLAATLAQRAERDRPLAARPLPRYAALRAGWPPAAEPAPSDATLQRAIDRLLEP